MYSELFIRANSFTLCGVAGDLCRWNFNFVTYGRHDRPPSTRINQTLTSTCILTSPCTYIRRHYGFGVCSIQKKNQHLGEILQSSKIMQLSDIRKIFKRKP